jgi:hypothetical protein
MSDKKGFIPKFGFFRTVNLFFAGLGLCFLAAYPYLSYELKRKEDEFHNELNSLKMIVKDKQPLPELPKEENNDKL